MSQHLPGSDRLLLIWVNEHGDEAVSVRVAFSGPVQAGQALADALAAIKTRGDLA